MKQQTAIVCLGRFGDLMATGLPICYHLSRGGERPALVVSRDYANITDGISYADPTVYPDRFENLNGAVDWAMKNYAHVLTPQTYGHNYPFRPELESFVLDGWNKCHLLQHWSSAVLAFDKRSTERELALVKKYVVEGRRLVLVCTAGKSSPFPYAQELREMIGAAHQNDVQIINLDEIKADRIYDLLALMERASVLVTIDTAILHLSHAVPQLPVVALLTNVPSLWHGAKCRPNVVLSLRYNEWSARKGEVLEAVRWYAGAFTQRLIHAYSDFNPPNPETKRRVALAARTWKSTYEMSRAWIQRPIKDSELPRMFNDGQRNLGFIKTFFDIACQGRSDEDIIVFTNTDTCFAPSLTSRLLDRFKFVDHAYSYRRDFTRLDRPLTDEQILRGQKYVGADLFAFRVSWWKRNAHILPDLVQGLEAWDYTLRVLMESDNPQHHAISFDSLIFHERHESRWETPQNRKTLPGQIHCRKVAKEFVLRYGQYDGSLD